MLVVGFSLCNSQPLLCVGFLQLIENCKLHTELGERTADAVGETSLASFNRSTH